MVPESFSMLDEHISMNKRAVSPRILGTDNSSIPEIIH